MQGQEEIGELGLGVGWEKCLDRKCILEDGEIGGGRNLKTERRFFLVVDECVECVVWSLWVHWSWEKAICQRAK